MMRMVRRVVVLVVVLLAVAVFSGGCSLGRMFLGYDRESGDLGIEIEDGEIRPSGEEPGEPASTPSDEPEPGG